MDKQVQEIPIAKSEVSSKLAAGGMNSIYIVLSTDRKLK